MPHLHAPEGHRPSSDRLVPQIRSREATQWEVQSDTRKEGRGRRYTGPSGIECFYNGFRIVLRHFQQRSSRSAGATASLLPVL